MRGPVKKSELTKMDNGWLPPATSPLYEWEDSLRRQLYEVRWVGEIDLSLVQFEELCREIRREAGRLTPRPERLPAAVFITSLVFSARYAEPTEEDDERRSNFWGLYQQMVWQQPDWDAHKFQSVCRARYKAVVPYLEAVFTTLHPFPRRSEGDLVAPVFRHALLPNYVQEAFAEWLSSHWREILAWGDDVPRLIEALQDERSLGYLPVRLQRFMRHPDTAVTATAIITKMAYALQMYIEERTALPDIQQDLTRIEQNVWHKLVEQVHLAEAAEAGRKIQRMRRARVDWVWDLARGEMVLRVQGVSLAEPANDSVPAWLLWVDENDAMLDEIELRPWPLEGGGYLLETHLLSMPNPDGIGELVIHDDYGQEAWRHKVPALPAEPIQFFRLTQQGAFGVPVPSDQLSDGTWLVCGQRPWQFYREDELVEPESTLHVPYPWSQGNGYQWAAQFTLALPVNGVSAQGERLSWSSSSEVPAVGKPVLSGQQVAGLSPYLPPVFTDTEIAIRVAYGAEALLRHASLRILGMEDGAARQVVSERLSDLAEMGMVKQVGDGLTIYLVDMLHHGRADLYRVELRYGLQPVWPAPQEFAVVPGLQLLETPQPDVLYTPANLPTVHLAGVEPAAITRQSDISVADMSDGSVLVKWLKLEKEPSLILQFGQRRITLAWPVQRCAIWLKPAPTDDAVWHMVDVCQCRLQGVVTDSKLEVGIWLDEDFYPLRFERWGGRYNRLFEQTQLYEGVRQTQQAKLTLFAAVQEQKWRLVTIGKKPEIKAVEVQYDEVGEALEVVMDVEGEWQGHGRVQAHTTNFKKTHEIMEIERLSTTMRIPCTLPNGRYTLGIEFEGEQVLGWLPERSKQFTVSRHNVAPPKIASSPQPSSALSERHLPQQKVLHQLFEDTPEAEQLWTIWQQGAIVPMDLAEHFLRWGIALALEEQLTLTPAYLWQLATLPGQVLIEFDEQELTAVWQVLVSLRQMHDQTTQAEQQKWFLWHILSAKRRALGDKKQIVTTRRKMPEPPSMALAKLSLTRLQRTKWDTIDNEIQAWRQQPQLMRWQVNIGRVFEAWMTGRPRLNVMSRLAFRLGVLLRTAVYCPSAYHAIIDQHQITTHNVQQLLLAFQQKAPDHLAWAVAWVESIYNHTYQS